MYNENYYGFRLTCLRSIKYLFFWLRWLYVVWRCLLFYSIFSIHAASTAFRILFKIFCHCYLAILMSRRYKCLALISLYCHLFSNHLSVDVLSVELFYRQSMWFFYGLNMTGLSLSLTIQMSRYVSLNSRLFCLAHVSRIIAMTCHVHVSLAGILFYGLNLANVSPRIFVRAPVVLKVEFNSEAIMYLTIFVFLSPGSCFNSVICIQNLLESAPHVMFFCGGWKMEDSSTGPGCSKSG